jgi:preprotein translocase subunit SecD
LSRALLLAPALALFLLLALSCGGGSDPEATLTLTADLSQLPPGTDEDEALGDAADILRQRAELYGIADPQIALGGNTISVTLKGVEEAAALQLMTRTGSLEFKRPRVSTDGLVVCKTPQGEEFGVPPQNVNPDDVSGSLSRCFSLDKLGEPVWVDADVASDDGSATRLTPEHVDPGSWQLQHNETALAARFTPEGSDLLKLITGALAGYHLGIFVDGELVAAPRIQRAITDGAPVISGFPRSEAAILAAVLNTAPLPVPLAPSP